MTKHPARQASFELTGWHVLAILGLFFGIIFLANGLMMRWAVSSFRGAESETPYRDGLIYNQELAAARRQEALGWKVQAHVKRAPDGAAIIEVEARDAAGRPIGGLTGEARLAHPADKARDIAGEFVADGAGRFNADLGGAPDGQWDLIIDFNAKGERVFLSRERIVLK